jgi:hypothetical protein
MLRSGKLGLMAAKKKSKKQKKKSPAKKALKVSSKKSLKKAAKGPAQKPVKKKAVQRKAAVKKASARVVSERKPPQKVRERREVLRPRFAGSRRESTLSGDADSQGLSEREGADSESVSELLEEGNAFEAGVVEGVERADDADGREVRTREFPEDDVPEEYLEKDE